MKKISKTKIASTYGLALYEAAISEKSTKGVFDDVVRLYDILTKESDIVGLLANPIWNTSSKKNTLSEIAKKIGLTQETLNCLDVVADNGRFAELPQILAEFMHIYYVKNGIVEVKAVSAKKMSVAQCNKLQIKMEKKLGRKVVLRNEIDANIIGGLRVMYESDMIDASLEDKINRLENVMKGGL